MSSNSKNKEIKNDIFRIDNSIELHIPKGEYISSKFPYVDAGDHLIALCQAAWRTDSPGDFPLHFRLIGAPGVGKNAAIYKLAADRKQELFVIQGNEELTPEDIVVSATIKENGKIEYIASPLVAAMIRGGILFFDEIAKVRPRSLAPLASVLDERRKVFSAILGRWIKADSNFRFCAAYNPTDFDSFDLAPWIRARTVPEFEVQRPRLNVLQKIAESRNSTWSATAREVLSLSRKIKHELDAGQMLKIISYAEKIRLIYNDNENFGNPIEIAFNHILGIRAKEKIENLKEKENKK